MQLRLALATVLAMALEILKELQLMTGSRGSNNMIGLLLYLLNPFGSGTGPGSSVGSSSGAR